MSSIPSKNARIDDILAELRRQDWRLETSTDSSAFRCFPPDAQKRMVTVSTRLANGNAIVEILRHLRHQGFVWPPPERERPRPDPVVRSVPFPPQPSPAVSTAEREESRPPLETSTDISYIDLKESKEYVDLAASELRVAQAHMETVRAQADAALAGAQARLEKATGDYKAALSDLRQKKTAFDAQFAAEEPS